MKMIKIIDRKLNIVELPCGKWTNSIDISKLDANKKHKLNTNNNG